MNTRQYGEKLKQEEKKAKLDVLIYLFILLRDTIESPCFIQFGLGRISVGPDPKSISISDIFLSDILLWGQFSKDCPA